MGKIVLNIISVRGLLAALACILRILIPLPQLHRIHFSEPVRRGTKTISHTCTQIFAHDCTHNLAPARVCALLQFYVKLKSLKRCANLS